jgi:hypothetical protein
MQNTLFSSAYLPPIEYFYFLLKAENSVVERFETYKKQTYRNRCYVYTEKGKTALSIPISKPFGNHTKTSEIEIFYSENWQLNHWKTISTAYQSSPFFLYYKDELEVFYKMKFTKLIDFNNRLMQTLIEMLEIDVSISFSGHFEKPSENENDLRFKISPKEDSLLSGLPPYSQVFDDRHGFLPNLSIIDLLFNKGPEAGIYLNDLSK